ncbi:MAG: ribosome small subunit-dependent GTPase A [Planctomycetes bacterium]|nr:ribosome small subunit-dependent GTPase A [Planctomycetota bacterium]
MDLIDFGWNDKFAQQFNELEHPDLTPARVAREDRNQYLLYTTQGGISGEVTGKFLNNHVNRSDFPAVGDWVAAEILSEEDKAMIHAVLPRRSKFSRKLKGNTTEEQVLASNIDTLFIVNGLDDDYNIRRIERYLTLVWNSGAEPIIVLNKADICSNLDEITAEVLGISFGVPVMPVSAVENIGFDELRKHLKHGKTSAFIGSSGVGKSSIINCLLGESRQKVKEVRAWRQRGQHTTTSRELFLCDNLGMLIDSPGIRELQLWANDESLTTTFEDIDEFTQKCKFRDCQHINEPGCAVLQALEDDELDYSRYESYLKQQKELKYLDRKQNIHAQKQETLKWKKIKKSMRKRYKKRN